MPQNKHTTGGERISELTAAETRPLRQRVLRPHQHPDELVYPGDDEPESFHLGVRIDGELAGIISVYVEPMPGTRLPSWRIRGMATAPEHQRTGLGSRLLDAAIGRTRATRPAPVWCNARESALGFYERFGFVAVGERFDIPGIGPHFVMMLGVER